MKGYIITGTSSGIGKALCELLLKDENNEVIGISRTQKIYHSNYKHISLDLNIVNQIEKIKFPDWNNSEQISLIHNAGFKEHAFFESKLSNSGWPKIPYINERL